MARVSLEQFKHLVDQIEACLDQDIQMLDLANQYGVSPWYFQKLFRALVGDSLGAYMRGRRLAKAVNLLKTTDLGILDIALEVGFNSHEAFSRAFKAQFNINPKEVREKNVVLNLLQKPVLTEELLRFLESRFNASPDIKVLPKKRIVGFALEIESPFTDKVHCSTIATPWMQLLTEIPKMGIEIKSAELHGVTLSASGLFTEDTLTYLAGVQVSDDFVLPNGMVEMILPEQLVGVFELATHVVDDNLKQKIDSIYGFWLMNSNYDRANGHDYEYFKNMIDPIQGKFDSYYVIPLQLKKN